MTILHFVGQGPSACLQFGTLVAILNQSQRARMSIFREFCHLLGKAPSGRMGATPQKGTTQMHSNRRTKQFALKCASPQFRFPQSARSLQSTRFLQSSRSLQSDTPAMRLPISFASMIAILFAIALATSLSIAAPTAYAARRPPASGHHHQRGTDGHHR